MCTSSKATIKKQAKDDITTLKLRVSHSKMTDLKRENRRRSTKVSGKVVVVVVVSNSVALCVAIEQEEATNIRRRRRQNRNKNKMKERKKATQHW